MNRFLWLISIVFPLLMTACASSPSTVVFVTKTSIGIDVEQTPPSATIAYDRVEGYVGPRFENGAVPPVLATFTTNGQLLGREVKQVFATGNAAQLLANPLAGAVTEPDLKGSFKPLFFGSSTTLGLKIGFDASGSSSSFTLGYKRKELSVIPVTEAFFPSVLATVQTDVNATTAKQARFGAGQLFATGLAATELAKRPEVRGDFLDRADAALNGYRAEERQQSRHALVTLSCLAGLSDQQLSKVWSNAAALDVLDKDSKVSQFGELAPSAAREKYTSYLALLNSDSRDTSLRMQLHRQYVCGLAGR